MCVAAYGSLPYHALGVGQKDPWHHPYAYSVSPEFADDIESTTCGPAPGGVSFGLCATGTIEVLDETGSQVAQNLPAIILTHGKVRFVGTSANQARNISEARNFNPTQHASGTANSKRQRKYSDVSGSEFDDLVDWVSPNILKAKMVSAGRLP